jgi:hypothetical protein
MTTTFDPYSLKDVDPKAAQLAAFAELDEMYDDDYTQWSQDMKVAEFIAFERMGLALALGPFAF